MKYPKFDGRPLDENGRKRFEILKSCAFKSIKFDNGENDLNLTEDAIELLAWNIATIMVNHLGVRQAYTNKQRSTLNQERRSGVLKE